MVDHDDNVIDITPYLRGDDDDDDDSVFTLWGGDAERARFALPLWRAAYLFNGRRAALVSTASEEGARDPEALTILDLRSEQARTEFQAPALLGLEDANKPGTAARADQGVAVYLGEEDGRRWYLVVDDVEEREGEETPEPNRPMADLLFLAGECAGLLFFRRLASSEHGWVDED